jgi:TetR/AcrR family transcriptional regulator, cholesterol catabolism regulator
LRSASKKPRIKREPKRKKTHLKAAVKIRPRARVSRDLILRVAARLFRQQGYSATTLRQIAVKANMKAGSIYYHFDSKTTILEEILELGLRRIFDAVKASAIDLGTASHQNRISAAIRAHLVTLLQESDYTSANMRIYGQLPERIKKRHRPLRRAYGKYWDRMLSDAQRAGEIRSDIVIVPLRRFILGALNWTVEWFEARRNSSVEDLANRTTLLIFQGILSR